MTTSRIATLRAAVSTLPPESADDRLVREIASLGTAAALARVPLVAAAEACDRAFRKEHAYQARSAVMTALSRRHAQLRKQEKAR